MSMTESEALEWFKGFYNADCERENFEDTICADCNFPCRHGMPILRAISAIEEVQQYREIIGLTPEDLKALEKDEIQTIGDALKAFAEWSQYKEIGTVEELRQLKEKIKTIKYELE